jgi:O-antigen ligase
VVLAQSRSAYVGLAVVIGLGLLAVLPMRLRLYASAFVLGGAIALTIIALPFLPALMPIFTTAPADGPSLVFSTTSLLQRYTFWVYGLATLRDFPLTGVGLDTFRYAIFLLFNLPCSAEVCDISHVHNEFLQVGLGLGVPGLVGFGSLYLGAFWMLFRLYTRRGVLEGFPLKLMALGLGGGLLAHCIFGLTDAVLLAAKPDILFWMLLGLVAGLYQQFDNESEFIKGSEQEKTG